MRLFFNAIVESLSIHPMKKFCPLMSERDNLLFIAQVLDQTNRNEEMVSLMKRVVDLNPVLSTDERNLLSVAYKNIVTIHRSGLRILSAVGDHDDGTATPWRIAQIAGIRERISSELKAACLDLINMVGGTLIPACSDDESRMFFEKLRADYYRYMCEATSGDDLTEITIQARKSYEDAIEIAKGALPPASPGYLGLVLDYTVFLFEVVRNRAEAIELAQKTYSECSSLVDSNSEEIYSEATILLQILREKITNWIASAE
jgi:14-3-3 protein epsilon